MPFTIIQIIYLPCKCIFDVSRFVSTVDFLTNFPIFFLAGTGIFGNTALGQTTAAKPTFNFSLGSTTTGAAPAGTGLFGNTQTGNTLILRFLSMSRMNAFVNILLIARVEGI